MTWTIAKEEGSAPVMATKDGSVIQVGISPIPTKLNVRAIIDIDNEQAELKDLIASLQKHVKEEK